MSFIDSAEQQARDLLEQMGYDDAQSRSAGEVVLLANLIRERNLYKGRYSWLKHVAPLQIIAIAWGRSKTACQYGEGQVDDAVDAARIDGMPYA